ncbi:hypothetical protein [Haloferax sp. DFSO60]|uniref:hypothetical protein n=1 Tax=Haloferax sp. DFSO60 TaxID=3388652 RepID=UPI00397E3DCB
MIDPVKAGVLIVLGSGFTALNFVLMGFQNYAGPTGSYTPVFPLFFAIVAIAFYEFKDYSSSTSEEPELEVEQ